ncbi:MFS transporter [Acidilobus sp. 7A]|uniref:MFS transporter n=1 Tax=Acidilobus sp. 7A TaxID=1577685 RepID=UPI001F02E146|nr:MFS transporter [Acidilobus sp. 7A]
MDREKVSSAAGLAQAVAIIVTLTFSVRASNNVLQTTVPLLAKFDLTYTQLEVGLLMATMSASALMAALVNSRVSVTARRRLFILFSALYALSLFTFTFSNRVSVLAYVSLAGVSYGFIFPNIMTAAQLFPDQRLRERVIAAYTLALAISLIAGPALESLVLAHFPLRLSFLFFTPLGIIVAALSPLVRFPREPGKRREDRGKGPSVWSRVGFRIGIYTFLVYSAPTAVLLTFGGIFVREAFHAPYWLVTLIFAAFFTASFLTRVLLLTRPIGRLIPYVITMMSISLAGLTLVAISRSLLLYVVAFSVLGVPHGLGMPLAMISISRSFPEEERNRANSYFTSTMMAMQIAMPLVGGLALRYTGFRALMLYTIPAVLFLLLLTLWERAKLGPAPGSVGPRSPPVGPA